MIDDVFQPSGPILVRMAAAPPVDPELHDPANPLAVVRAVAKDPILREGIRLASGSLSTVLDQCAADAEDPPASKRVLRAARSATRYRQRSGGRPTPFGLFAGVAVARIGSATRVAVRGPAQKSVRLDTAWLDQRVREWLGSPEVRRRVAVMINDLGYVRGDRLLLPTPDSEISVRLNPLVAWVHATATAPTPYTDLLASVTERHPGVPEHQLDHLFAQLIRHGFLLTSISPQRVDDVFLTELETAVSAVPGAAEGLRDIQARLQAYQDRPAGQGDEALRRLVDRLDPAGELRHTPVHVDLRMDAEVVVPPVVMDEARRFASAMWAISVEGATHGHLQAYWERFVEQYGLRCPVALPELIDPHRGLGFPAGYRNPPRPEAAHHSQASPTGDPHRRALIAELVQAATVDGSGEVMLTDDDIERLAAPVTARPPRSLELCFQLYANSAVDLDRGNFRLFSTPFAGSWMAGATAGRFAGLLGLNDDLTQLMAGLSSDQAGNDTVLAQVRFSPRSARALNVVQVPQLLPYELPVGVFADPRESGHIDWRDLVVTAEPGGLRLNWARTGQQVIPAAPHMLALDREAPNLVRLLLDIVFARRRTWTGWDWAGLDALPFLPRIRYGKVVAAPRRWRPDRRLRETAADPTAWGAALRDWRNRYQVPDRVQILQWDRAYGIDLRNSWHQRLLQHEMTKGPLALVEDLNADGQGLGWAQGHSTELVVPFTRRTPERPVSTPVRLPPRERHPRHLPGGEWLYAKLYATPDVHDSLLRTHVAELLSEVADHVDRWFFIRYRDPEPHLRLRLHGTPAVLNAQVLPALRRHARSLLDNGMLRSLELACYEPEIARYGGAKALELAELLFCLDSRSVISQLQHHRDIPSEVLIAVHHALLLECLGDWDWASWIDQRLPKSQEHAAFQRHRALALDLIQPGKMVERVANQLAAPDLARLWRESCAPGAYGALALATPDRDAVLALLHMQHNRLLGTQRTSEKAGLAILRGAARSHLARPPLAGSPE